MFKKVAFLAVVGAAVASHSASAAQQTGTMAVTATINASCTLATNPLAFGSLTNVNGSPIQVQTTVDVDCTTDSPFNIGIDYGSNPSGSTRRMASGANLLTYTVSIDGYGVTAFGPISSYLSPNNYSSPATGNNGLHSVTIWGEIPSQSTPPSGSYSDTLTVTLQY
ncbi:MAG: spore coat U domain-containing protein [Hyphomicrobium sp.]